MQKLFKLQLALLAGTLLARPNSALASCHTNPTTQAGIDCAGSNMQANLTGQGGLLTNIIILLISIAGIASVIMIIIGGFRYIFSQGAEKATKEAKDTILYAVIGLVVSIVAFAIVNYVLGNL